MSVARDTGRPGCTFCHGHGSVPADPAGEITLALAFAVWTLPGGEKIMPCPACLEFDHRVRGTTFFYHGHRMDPATIRPTS